MFLSAFGYTMLRLSISFKLTSLTLSINCSNSMIIILEMYLIEHTTLISYPIWTCHTIRLSNSLKNRQLVKGRGYQFLKLFCFQRQTKIDAIIRFSDPENLRKDIFKYLKKLFFCKSGGHLGFLARKGLIFFQEPQLLQFFI